jgi:hypothetical protein
MLGLWLGCLNVPRTLRPLAFRPGFTAGLASNLYTYNKNKSYFSGNMNCFNVKESTFDAIIFFLFLINDLCCFL